MSKQLREAELEPRPGDEHPSPDALLKVSIFDGLKAAALERLPGAVVLRRYAAGETVCRQGDAGWTAFYILRTEDLLAIREHAASNESGATPGESERRRKEIDELRNRLARLRPMDAAQAELAAYDALLARLEPDVKLGRSAETRPSDPALAERLRLAAEGEMARTKATVSLTIRPPTPSSRGGGLFARILGGLWAGPRAPSENTQRFIPIDGPVDLAQDNPVAALHEGELLGEMSCMNRYPRSATVRVTADCYMIEMLRNVLELLQKNKAFSEQMNATYRRRVLETHLRALPIFAYVSDDALVRLAQKVELVEKQPGEMIFEQGSESDSMYVIRIGMVKVTEKERGGERVVAYRGRGEYIGEMGLILNQPRSASCIAVDHPVGEGDRRHKSGRVELIKVARADFEELCRDFPALDAEVRRVAGIRSRPKPRAGTEPVLFGERASSMGFHQGQKLMLIDLDRCTRCDECVRACASTHADGRTRLLREGPRFGRFLVPASCRQCLDPVCMIGCPVGSIHKGDRDEIKIEDWCIGCQICAKQCPYDSILMYERPLVGEETEVAEQAVVCDQCSSLADGVPSCVYACPHDAALRVDARTFFGGQSAGLAL